MGGSLRSTSSNRSFSSTKIYAPLSNLAAASFRLTFFRRLVACGSFGCRRIVDAVDVLEVVLHISPRADECSVTVDAV